MRRPTAVEPVKATLSMPRMVDQRRTDVTCSGDDVHHPRRQIGVGDDLGQHQDRQWRRLSRLDHYRVASGERRGDLPGSHQQREVPRDDLAGDTQRLRARAQAKMLQLVSPPGVVEEVLRGGWHVEVPGLLDRLAVVEGFHDGELAGPLGDATGDPEQELAALGARHVRDQTFS